MNKLRLVTAAMHAGSFNGELTGEQNCRFVARVYGIDTDELIYFVEDFAELGPYLREPVRSYSSGMRARLAFDNADGALKPGMYAEVTVFGGAQRDATLVPSEAVIRTGTRNLVLVAEGEGRYRPVQVTLGPERGEEMVVAEGLEPGQQVVVSGQFLIDSEASLLGAYQRMGAADEGKQPPAASMRNMGGEPSPGAYEIGTGDGQ